MRYKTSNTPPRVMDSDSDDDHPIAEDDLEIIDDDEIIDEGDYISDENESNIENEDPDAEMLAESAPLTEWIDDAKLVFKKHTSSVFCCAVNKNDSIIVTGGEDDKAYLWNLQNGEVLFECTGHEDSVTHVGFNHDGSLVATGDMKGIVKVWNVQEKEKVWEFETSDLRWLAWHQAANILFAGSMEGEAWMWLVPSGVTKTFPSSGSPISCGKLFTDGKRMVLGYEDGTIRIWDLKSVSVIHAIAGVNAHTENVISVDCSSDNALVLTGSEDGTMKLINVLNGKVINSFNIDSSPIESVAFSPRSSLIAAGTLNGTVVILDVSTQSVRHKIEGDGLVKIVWHPVTEKFFAACLNGNIQLLDARNGQEDRKWRGHKGDLLDIILTSDGSKIITACDDYECRVFEYTT